VTLYNELTRSMQIGYRNSTIVCFIRINMLGVQHKDHI